MHYYPVAVNGSVNKHPKITIYRMLSVIIDDLHEIGKYLVLF